MFGQAMATLIPPMLPGTVIFMNGYNPVDIIGLIRRRRVSVLVSVPKMLDVLRAHVLRVVPEAAAAPPKTHWLLRWWRYRQIHRLFGLKFWSFVVGAAPLDAELEAFWSERGFAVIQGYGLTETAPIVSVTHPFHIERGSVGKAIAGVDVMIAPDGEILVRGDNVSSGYFHAEAETAKAFEGSWFHTGDIGEIRPDGRLFIRGRKKEVIVTPEGLKVFPEDVERVLNQIPGVRDSAAVGRASDAAAGNERVHAVLVLEPGVDPDVVARDANARLEDHQKIRRALVWPEAALPRTEGTGKLKRAAIRDWVRTGQRPSGADPTGDRMSTLVAKIAGRGDISPATTIDELGLSSLERIELMVALEDAFQTHLDEKAFSEARDMGQMRALVEESARGEGQPSEMLEFPAWTRSTPARAIRRVISAGAPSAADAHVCADPRRRARASENARGARDLCVESPELHGCAGDHGGAARAVAVSPRAGDGEGVLHGAFLPERAWADAAGRHQCGLLSGSASLQCIPAAATRGRCAPDAALHGRAARESLLRADLS